MKLHSGTILQARHTLNEHPEHEKLFRKLDVAYDKTYSFFQLGGHVNVELSQDETTLIISLLEERKESNPTISSRDSYQNAIDDLQKFLD